MTCCFFLFRFKFCIPWPHSDFTQLISMAQKLQFSHAILQLQQPRELRLPRDVALRSRRCSWRLNHESKTNPHWYGECDAIWNLSQIQIYTLWYIQYTASIHPVYIQYTPWLFNIAMENCPFIDYFPSYSMAMLNNQMVLLDFDL